MMEEDVLGAVLVGSWGLVILGALWFCGHLIQQHRKRVWLRQHGLPAEATVLRLQDTWIRINRSRVFDFLLEVRLPGHAPYQVRLRSRWNDWNVRVMDVGLRLKVKLDPNDLQKLVVMGPVVPQDLGKLLSGLGALGLAAPAPGDPVKGLADLQRMADEGLVTPEEYARKKAEILDRL
ncbi:SHOCT domain-containing protein [Corallococcus terminator]|uniref:SHOCT domain-containing protein n=1 Tax=Corallococcus terminator TaxID=2316733 RepID=A0A3A8I436_9BACT|nr:SHOCT domain-containing protein [Corallococcus terminator]RKG73021.1 SHOCT domain-containing protein [Corallococcus terminator]